MADYLSLAEWKPKAKEYEGGKDVDALLKPLDAYAKAKGDAARRKEALAAVVDAARGIKGKNAKNKDLAGDLDDVLSAAEKAGKELAKELEDLKAKGAVQKAKEKIADEVTFDAELVKQLLVVRNIGPDKARHFVLAPGKPAGMAISKVPITKKHKQQARGWRVGKGKLLEGTCYGERGKYVFDFGEMKPPAGLAKMIKGAALSQAEKSIKLKVRGGGVDLDDELDAGELEDLGEDNPAADAPDVPGADEPGEVGAEDSVSTLPSPPPSGGGTADFARRLKEALELAKRAAYLSNGVAMLGGGLAREAQALLAAGRLADALGVVKKLRDMANAAITSAGPMADQMIAHAQEAEAEEVERAAQLKSDPAARFTERLKRLQPRIKEAVGRGGDFGADVKRLASEAGMFARKKDFDRANEGLDQVEARLAEGEDRPEDDATAASSDPRLSELKERLGRAKAAVEALKGTDPARGREFAGRLARVAGLARDGQLPEALALLDELDQAIAAGPKPPSSGDGPSLVKLQQARLAWDAARKKVRAELARLRAAVLDDFREAPDFEEVARSAGRVEVLLDDLMDDQAARLDDALNAEGDDRDRLRGEAADALRTYRDHVDNDPVLSALDANPFTPIVARKTLSTTLGVLGKALGT